MLKSMYVMDMNQISIASIMAQGKQYRYNFNENLIRHILLSSILSLAKKFKFRLEKPEVVLCYDSYSWRKNIFPEYKANRKKSHEEDSLVDWNEIFRILNMLREEFTESLPYKVLHVDGCEADDLIASLCGFFQSKQACIGGNKHFTIISGDKDFIQLHTNTLVRQYDPVFKKDFITTESPRKFLIEHIVRGDVSDGIPNIKSDSNTFIDPNKRQKPIRQAEIDKLFGTTQPIESQLMMLYGYEVTENYRRNQKLIDLGMIPEEYKHAIVDAYIELEEPKRSMLLPYMIKKQLTTFVDVVNDF